MTADQHVSDMPPEMSVQLVAAKDAEWRERFSRIALQIEAAVPDAAIEHIGSTSVAGFAAKDVIDVLVGVDPAEVAHTASQLAAIGLDLEGQRSAHAWLSFPSRTNRMSVVHVVGRESAQWQDRIDFRDLLRQSSDARTVYLAHKQLCAAKHPGWGEYTAAKAEIVGRLLDAHRRGAPLTLTL